MKTPSNAKLAWLAGILEGEGSFCISTHRYRNKTPTKLSKIYTYRRIKIRLHMTDEDVVRRAHEIAGVGTFHVYNVRPRTSMKLKPQMYIWQISIEKDAATLMKRLKPYMSARRQEQIQTCLDFYADPNHLSSLT